MCPYHQVGMVAVGQPFPFWVHGKTMLTLKVSAAVPADLVRLVHGCEVYVAPRPRQRTAPTVPNGSAAGTAQPPGRAAEPLPPVWLRIQVRLSGGGFGKAVLHSIPLVDVPCACWVTSFKTVHALEPRKAAPSTGHAGSRVRDSGTAGGCRQ